jgi:hypothetical protein
MIIVPEREIADLVSEPKTHSARSRQRLRGHGTRAKPTTFPSSARRSAMPTRSMASRPASTGQGRYWASRRAATGPATWRPGMTNHQSTVLLFDPDTGLIPRQWSAATF